MRREAGFTPEHRKAGFTLLEVLVAFIIAAIALAALFSGGLGGLRAATVSGRYTEAISRAESHLAAASIGDALTSSDRQGDEGGGYHWHVRIAPVATATPVPGAVGNTPRLALYIVRASVSWTEQDQTRSVELDTMRAATAPPPPP